MKTIAYICFLLNRLGSMILTVPSTVNPYVDPICRIGSMCVGIFLFTCSFAGLRIRISTKGDNTDIDKRSGSGS